MYIFINDMKVYLYFYLSFKIFMNHKNIVFHITLVEISILVIIGCHSIILELSIELFLSFIAGYRPMKMQCQKMHLTHFLPFDTIL